jgi:prevent-host-death family protein
MPTIAGIREAKMHLSQYIKMVKQGQEVIITDRGQPVGKLVPFNPQDMSLYDRLQRLEELGILEPKQAQASHSKPLKVQGVSAQDYLQQDRNEKS